VKTEKPIKGNYTGKGGRPWNRECRRQVGAAADEGGVGPRRKAECWM